MAIDRRRFLALPAAVGIPAMAAKLIPLQVAEPERDESHDISYQLDCGRWVTVEECRISISTLGVLAGSREAIRRRLIEDLSRNYLLIPVPEGKLPNFVFIVHLVSEPISDQEARLDDGSRVMDPISGQPVRHYDGSQLTVCWLSDDITTSLPELIKRETRAIEWSKYAVDFQF